MTRNQTSRQEETTRRARRERILARVARFAPSEFPTLLRRPEHFAHRYLDDAHRHVVARLPAHQIALLLGTVGFAGQIPTFLLAPFAGVIVDRIDRRKVLGLDADSSHGAVARAGLAHAFASHHHLLKFWR